MTKPFYTGSGVKLVPLCSFMNLSPGHYEEFLDPVTLKHRYRRVYRVNGSFIEHKGDLLPEAFISGVKRQSKINAGKVIADFYRDSDLTAIRIACKERWGRHNKGRGWVLEEFFDCPYDFRYYMPLPVLEEA